jgi:hypothetical protein
MVIQTNFIIGIKKRYNDIGPTVCPKMVME